MSGGSRFGCGLRYGPTGGQDGAGDELEGLSGL